MKLDFYILLPLHTTDTELEAFLKRGPVVLILGSRYKMGSLVASSIF